MRKLTTTMLAFALLAVPASAEACGIMIAPEQRIAQAYENGTTSAVALVQILSAEHTREPMGDTHPWKASARMVTSLDGNEEVPATVTFERGWGSAACEWSVPPLPQVGDYWVVYLYKDQEGVLRVWMALTGDEAVRFDPANFGEIPS